MRTVACLAILAALLLSFIACAPSRQSSLQISSQNGISVLTALLITEEARIRIERAQRDLPADVWVSGSVGRPGLYNRSRTDRESQVAQELLASLDPKLRKFSAKSLLDSIKTTSPIPTEEISGVAYYVYLVGNHAIMRELSKRPRSELMSLEAYKSDTRPIFTGDAGGYATIGDFIKETLLKPD